MAYTGFGGGGGGEVDRDVIACGLMTDMIVSLMTYAVSCDGIPCTLMTDSSLSC